MSQRWYEGLDRSALARAIHALPTHDDRELAELHCFRGYGAADLAFVKQVPRSDMQQTLRRLRIRIQNHMTQVAGRHHGAPHAVLTRALFHLVGLT